MQLEFVIARYKENVEWAERYAEKYHAALMIYNKFEGENLLPNIGFEAHTYLWHIVHRYDTLADMTVFCQGNTFYHCSPRKFDKRLSELTPNTKFVPMTPDILMCADDGSPHHTGLGIKRFWENLFGTPCPPTICFSAGAIFAVSADTIRGHDLPFYDRLLHMVRHKGHACIMERLWPSLFFNPIPSRVVKL